MAGDIPKLICNAKNDIEAIECMISGMLNMNGAGYGALLNEDGMRLLSILTIIAVALSSMMNVLKGEAIQKILMDYMIIMLTWGIAAAIIGSAQGGTVSNSLAKDFMGGFDQYAAKLSGHSDMDGLNKSVTNIVGKSFATAGKLFDTTIEASKDSTEKTAKKYEDAGNELTGLEQTLDAQ